MKSSSKDIFYSLMKDKFSPVLRELGFKGSGQNFRRIKSEVIHTVNIQANKYGGSCCINLGLHFSFLPLTWSNDQRPDLNKIKELDCEFRSRLAPKGKTDYWWKYDGGLFYSPSKSVNSIIEMYKTEGEPKFINFSSIESVVNAYTVESIENGKFSQSFGSVVPVRAALTMARINLYLGNLCKAKEFATIGLKHIGCAIALKPEFESILNET